MKIAEARQFVKDNGMSVTKTTSMDEIVDFIIDNALQEDAIAEGFDESLFNDNDTSEESNDSFTNLFSRSQSSKKNWERVTPEQFNKLKPSERARTMSDEQIADNAEAIEIKSVRQVQVNGEDRWIVLTTLNKRFWLSQCPPSSGVIGITKIPVNTWFPNWENNKMTGVMRCLNQEHYRISKDEFKLTYADRIKIQAKAQVLATDATAE